MVWGVNYCDECDKNVGSHGANNGGGQLVWACPDCGSSINIENDPNFDF